MKKLLVLIVAALRKPLLPGSLLFLHAFCTVAQPPANGIDYYETEFDLIDKSINRNLHFTAHPRQNQFHLRIASGKIFQHIIFDSTLRVLHNFETPFQEDLKFNLARTRILDKQVNGNRLVSYGFDYDTYKVLVSELDMAGKSFQHRELYQLNSRKERFVDGGWHNNKLYILSIPTETNFLRIYEIKPDGQASVREADLKGYFKTGKYKLYNILEPGWCIKPSDLNNEERTNVDVHYYMQDDALLITLDNYEFATQVLRISLDNLAITYASVPMLYTGCSNDDKRAPKHGNSIVYGNLLLQLNACLERIQLRVLRMPEMQEIKSWTITPDTKVRKSVQRIVTKKKKAPPPSWEQLHFSAADYMPTMLMGAAGLGISPAGERLLVKIAGYQQTMVDAGIGEGPTLISQYRVSDNYNNLFDFKRPDIEYSYVCAYFTGILDTTNWTLTWPDQPLRQPLTLLNNVYDEWLATTGLAKKYRKLYYLREPLYRMMVQHDLTNHRFKLLLVPDRTATFGR